ncbi:MAG: hypothetical protein JRC89_08900 [Deltaproteobacteria bacterium]|nr:hypothetical protein [Deltaproteobacteria bacterium]
MTDASSKDIFIEEITSLKELSSYFNYDDIKKLLKEKKIQITNSTLKTYLHSLTKDKVIFDAGKGWYSSIEKQFELNKAPIKEIIKTINQKLPLLSFSCWSTEQLNSFTHHILSKFITFVYTDSDYIRITAEILNDAAYSAYENPTKAEIAKLFKLNEKTVVLRPSIFKQPENSDNCSSIEKILVDFLIENRKFKIMENSEAEQVAKNALNSGRLNISALFSYAKRRELVIPNTINQVRNNIKSEIVD